MQQYSVRRAADVTRDLDLIKDHLVKTDQEFGEEFASAVARAASRINEALAYLRTFVTYPHRGTIHTEIRAGLRTVTNQNFIYYFEVDDLLFEVRIIAIFFGSINHQQQIIDRGQN